MQFEELFTSNLIKLGEENKASSIADVFTKSFGEYFKDLIDTTCLSVEVGINSVVIFGVLLKDRSTDVLFELKWYNEVVSENDLRLVTVDYTLAVKFEVNTVSLYYESWERNIEDRYGIYVNHKRFPKDIRWLKDNLHEIYKKLIEINRLSPRYLRFYKFLDPQRDVDVVI